MNGHAQETWKLDHQLGSLMLADGGGYFTICKWIMTITSEIADAFPTPFIHRIHWKTALQPFGSTLPLD
jgi:hypothetical protein